MTSTESLPLLGQHAVVTGGGKGIGAAIADELARLGASLSLLGRDEDALRAHADILQARHGTDVHRARLDVRSADEVSRTLAEIESSRGAIHILVNNAGAATSAPFARTDPALWEEMLAVNLTSAYLCSRAVVPGMVRAGYGRIVNVASTASLRGYAYAIAYTAAKHGVLGLTRGLALELVRSGVTVNAVCPGYTDTELTARTIQNITAKTGRSADAALAELERTNPQGRLIQPGEVAQVVGWLCLPASRSITGQAIAVAGGEVMPG